MFTTNQIKQLNNMNAASQRAQLGQAVAAMQGAYAGTTYYVDGNAGSDTANDGFSWASPFKTLSVALAASHANIAASAFGWTSRNTIYLKDDEVVENLTKLADKTDVIGVGSFDRNSQPRIKGNHVIAGSFMGTRFINCLFQSPAAGGDIMTLPTTVSGISFIGCTFDGNSTTAATGGIVATSVESLTVENCLTQGAFSDAVIEIAGVENNGLMIIGNKIQGGQQGIDVKSTVTTSIRNGYIMDNTIACATEGINEASGKIYVHRNYVVTLAAKGTAGAGAIVAGAKMMLQNHISCSDVANAVVPANGSL